MFKNILFAAVFAGLAAGLVMSGFSFWKVVPLIIQAEQYESADHDHHAVPAETSETEVAHADDHDQAVEESPPAWAPTDGFERNAYTVAANLLVGVGFALMLGAISVLFAIPFNLQNSLLWGLAGFITFSIAPSLGLAPELPGMPAGDLGARQVWWWATVVVTAAAFVTMAKFPEPMVIAGAIVALLVPHLLGAPQPEGHDASMVPAHLAANYVSAAHFMAAAFWLSVAPLYALSHDWLSKQDH
ncbi:CbtA family protein [Maritalea porphyrae]|jgi:cobalt transporter subunit CbtA|uniref:CbtA family protein n=1 Tax=Maritalea porphyrae TaxID=880732 RepID=UPI0022AF595B|nr:CbtA family protein [Maritalea porphyrae]MCZ4271807.1 CbtA family protein [Maritalea porphyrae]